MCQGAGSNPSISAFPNMSVPMNGVNTSSPTFNLPTSANPAAPDISSNASMPSIPGVGTGPNLTKPSTPWQTTALNVAKGTAKGTSNSQPQQQPRGGGAQIQAQSSPQWTPLQMSILSQMMGGR